MLQIAPRRKLKRFTEVTGKLGVDRQVRRLAEALDLTKSHLNADGNPKVDINYFTTSIAMGLSDNEKIKLISEIADTITTVGEKSDVVILAMWVSPTAG